VDSEAYASILRIRYLARSRPTSTSAPEVKNWDVRANASTRSRKWSRPPRATADAHRLLGQRIGAPKRGRRGGRNGRNNPRRGWLPILSSVRAERSTGNVPPIAQLRRPTGTSGRQGRARAYRPRSGTVARVGRDGREDEGERKGTRAFSRASASRPSTSPDANATPRRLRSTSSANASSRSANRKASSVAFWISPSK
jgi:hypothetical protein